MQEKDIENQDDMDTLQEAVEETAEDMAEEITEKEIMEKDITEKEETTAPKKEKKGFKRKKDKKDEQIEELNDRLMRTMAEFDNFRKRTEKEKSHMFEIGAKDIVERILPVIDNFERGLSAVSEDEKDTAFVQGIEQIYKQLMTTLEAAGVKTIEAVGKEFDPNFHNAVMHAEDDTLEENMVSEELQKGYMYRENVVRHSMVKVVN